jgi:hypothetical protein
LHRKIDRDRCDHDARDELLIHRISLLLVDIGTQDKQWLLTQRRPRSSLGICEAFKIGDNGEPAQPSSSRAMTGATGVRI